MVTLSANAQRIGDDIMQLVNAGNQSGGLPNDRVWFPHEKAAACGCESRRGKAETVAARQIRSIGA